MVSIITNGSRTYRWWKEAHEAKVLDALTITYHTEQSKDYQHVVDVLNLFHDDPTDVVCLITHTLDTLEFAFEAQDYIYNNTGALVFMKSMVLPGIDVYQYYTEEQLNKLKTLSRTPGIRSSTKKQPEIPKELRITQYLNVTYNDGSLETLHSQEFMKTRQNMFYGWSCDIGKKNMRIEYDNIRSAVCVSTKEQHLQDPSISFEPNTVTCPVEECKCAMQLIARKSIPNNT